MPNLSQLLSAKSSAEYQRVFNLCREISSELDAVDGVYVVGGVVRDLILDREPGDVDLSVVGDAAAFSTELASRLGAPAPSDSQFQTFKINVENIPEDVPGVDIVTARSETYSEPAALPEVVHSTLNDDLIRRDFSVNAMAISLTSDNWGTLIDPSNGFADIMRKRIKVLHDGSFVDDPTRIFRAVRYSVRLGFAIDPRTNELISKSLSNVDHLSSTRVRNEFELMLTEPDLVSVLQESEEIGLLAAISPGLRIGSKTMQVLESMTEDGSIPSDQSDLLALITFGLRDDEARQVVTRFDGPTNWGESITGNVELAKHVQVLDQNDIKPSEIVEILRDVPTASIRAYISAGPPLPRRDRLNQYLDKLQFVKPEITGDDLLAVGIPQGPVIGKLIDVVRRAKLDGQVSDKQEELQLAKSRLPGFLTS